MSTGDWIQGPDIQESTNQRNFADARQVTNTDVSSPNGGDDAGIVGNELTTAIEATLGHTTIGTSVSVGDFGSYATADWRITDPVAKSFSVTAQRQNQGISIYPDSLTSAAWTAARTYAYSNQPANATGYEFESSSLTYVGVAVHMPLNSSGTANYVASTPMTIRTYIRPAAATPTDTGTVVDERVSSAGSSVVADTPIDFTVTDSAMLDPTTGGLVIFPITTQFGGWTISQDFCDSALARGSGGAAQHLVLGDGFQATYTIRPPRFRYTFPGVGGASFIRHRQRGDGFGMSSAPRAFQNSTQQASLRNFGTY